jgi:Tol biopolymer transport system component
MKRAGALVAAALLGVGLAAASPHSARRIVFLSNWMPHFRTSEVYVLNAHGGHSRNLTKNELDDVDPSWSPDGKQVVFARRRHGSFDLYRMTARGGRARRLLSLPGDQRQPVWSPDGARIAFVSPGRERNEKGWRPPQLFVMKADGSAVAQVTHDEAGAGDPAWSPDSRKLAGSNGSIFTVDVDGSDLRELPPSIETEGDGHPSWSPDAARIAFERGELSFSTTDVWVMNADGSGQRRLARFGGQPAWSPDGRTIAFVNGDVWECDKDGCYEEGLSAIATIRVTGGQRHYVTRPLVRLGQSFGAPQRFLFSAGATFFGVRWSPNGRELLYARRLDERALDLFSLSPGGAPRRLTSSIGLETNAVTSPDGRHVMFARYGLGAGGPGVFVTNVHGGRIRRLAGHGFVGSWSPDGRRVAYPVQEGSRAPKIYIANADGSQPRGLADGTQPTWSPDGRRIAFVEAPKRGSSFANTIAVVDAAGSGPRLLLRLPHRFVYGLAWSPVADWVAFVNERPAKFSSFVELMNADTGATKRVTKGRFWDGSPVWAPDGRRLTFDRRLRGGSSELVSIVVCRVDGRGAHRLGKWRWLDSGPSWSPTGARIVFASRRSGTYAITTARPDGSDRRRLTHNLADNVAPSW